MKRKHREEERGDADEQKPHRKRVKTYGEGGPLEKFLSLVESGESLAGTYKYKLNMKSVFNTLFVRFDAISDHYSKR